jgi:DNA-directed RNA polymerase specialized sigma subunit
VSGEHVVKPKKRKNYFDKSFYTLAESVDKSLKSTEDGSTQKQQVEKLLKLEKQFKKEIINSSQGNIIYKKFLSMIIVTNGNRLTANPYFRENRVTFASSISPSLEMGNWKSLQKNNINYKMVLFMKQAWRGDFPDHLQKIFDEITQARNVLITNNMPLVINRAKRFFTRVPRSHLSLMDMISLCTAGLCTGIDKWSKTTYSPVFLSVCIGRMTANLMEAYNETTISFSPEQEKILYRARRASLSLGTEDLDCIAKAINLTLEKDGDSKRITKQELEQLIGASSIVPIENGTNTGVDNQVFDTTLYSNEEENMENSLIKRDLSIKAHGLIEELDLVTIKILKMKGMYEK